MQGSEISQRISQRTSRRAGDASGGDFPPGRVAWLALAVAGLWGAVIVLFALQLHFGNRLAWGDAFARSLLDRGPWAVLSPFILVLVWWLHRGGLKPGRIVGAHLFALLFALLAAEGLVQGVFLRFMFPMRVAAPLPPERAPGVPSEQAGEPFAKGPPDLAPPKGAGFPLPKGDGWPPPKGPGWPSPKREPRLPSDAPGPVMPPPFAGGPPPDFSPDTPPWMVFSGVALRKAYNGIPIYLVIAALAHAFFFWRNLREREKRVSELEERLTVARADLLRLQLEPHFLFNTLNSIGTLVYRDARLADDLIVRLSTLLRRLLDLRDERTVPLATEMETLRAYVAIEQARFGERLLFEETVAPEALEFPVPGLLLQPLAENAVRHGIEPLGRPGTLRVAAELRGTGVAAELAVLIEDDGVGMKAEQGGKRGFGLGLSSASVRLKALYGTAARVEALPRVGGGTRIEILLPRDPLPAAAAITRSAEND